MTKTFLPLAKSPITTPDLWSKVARNWLATGVIKAYLNELQVYAKSDGMKVYAKTGAANVQAIYFELVDTEEVLAIAVADASNPRIDRVIIRLDLLADTIDFAVLQGTPAVSPVAPALTQNNTRWEISLAQVYVAANASTIALGNITDERIYTGQRKYSYVEAYQSTGQAVGANTWTKVLYQIETIDTKNEFDPTNSRFTALEKGEYIVNATLLSAVPTLDAVVADLLIRKNGSDYVRLWGDTLKINKNTLMAGSTILTLQPGDYIEAWFQVGGMGGTVNPNTAPGYLSSIFRVYQIGV